MKANIGRLDQAIRITISLVFIYVGFIDKELIYDPLSSNIIGVIGVVFLIVGTIRFCPLYLATNINTCRKSKS